HPPSTTPIPLAPVAETGDHRVVDPLADPPLVQHLLLEQPWPTAIVLLALAVGLTVAGRRRRRRGLRMGAWVAAVAAGAVVGLAWQVQTPREQIMAATRQLVAATAAPLDLAGLDNRLAPGMVVTGPDGTAWIRRDQIDRRLTQLDQRHAIVSHDIHRLEADAARPNRGRTALELRTHLGQSNGYGPIRSTWQLHWRRDDAQSAWQVHEIQCVSINRRTPSRHMLQP
ncbi:MAG: hypothetical protein ACODAQ_11165, partial [Phycisphaeraceae bacterium]